MSAASAQTLIDLLLQETKVRHGPVPPALGGQMLMPGRYLITAEEYLLRTDTGLGFHYRKGSGVIAELPDDTPPGELELWLKGSVHAAIAALNGLLPLHASAVAHGGRVFAIGGASGAGKSTLAAGLGKSRMPLFCDDTLLIDLSDPQELWCLPGHKRLKLTEAALALTGSASLEKVGVMIDKFYAQPPSRAAVDPLPLGALLFLEDRERFGIAPISGGERIARMNEDHYTTDFYAAAHRLSLTERFANFTRISKRLDMHRLSRPRDVAAFPAVIAQTSEWIRSYRP